ncbi:MAG: hypothetical protein JWR66_3562 [Modestobacter sp.]|jgi:hypothetical protein|nr:hypothetical protein [Modestobacter sp.]
MTELSADGIDRVQDAGSFAAFVARLRQDDDLDDLSLDDFLEQMQAWVGDGVAVGASDLFAADASYWRFAAGVLLAAAVYE